MEEKSSALPSDCNDFRKPPIHRHLQTIGIGPVFLSPPPSDTLYTLSSLNEGNNDSIKSSDASSLQATSNSSNDIPDIISSWEIVGSIKTVPEDFEVKEIGGLNKKNNNNIAEKHVCDTKWKLADLSEGPTATIDIGCSIEKAQENHDQGVSSHLDSNTDNVATMASSVPEEQSMNTYNEPSGATNESTNVKEKPYISSSHQHEKIILNVSTPAEAIEKILDNALSKIVLSDNHNNDEFSKNNEVMSGEINIRVQNHNEVTFKSLQKMNDMARKYMESFDISMTEAKCYDETTKNANDNIEHNDNEVENRKSKALPFSRAHNPVINIDDWNTLWIPPIIDNKIIQIKMKEHESKLFQEQEQQKKSNTVSNRATFHKCLKLVFPMLKSETVPSDEGKIYLKNILLSVHSTNPDITNQESALSDEAPLMIVDIEGNQIDQQKNRWIRIKIDETFFDLKSYLAFPSKDLISLYTFRNKGCQGFTPKNKNGRGRCHSRDRNKKQKIDNCNEADTKTEENDVVTLRLIPNLSRDKRREIHHLFARKSRELETGTINGIPLVNDSDGQVDSKSLMTIGITARWSQQAQRIAARKRKRNQVNHTDSSNYKRVSDGNEFPKEFHTLCVLKKRNIEHLSAINHLVEALKCRQSDIGLAGMKDMRGETYQFCTLRNIGYRKAQKANSFLHKKSIEIGKFERVEWLLNLGDLYGNQFSIIVRNLRQVQIRRQCCRIERKSEIDNPIILEEERFLPCQASHIDAMVERVQNCGFINYYGQQRVGDPGESYDVGVRSFDIGRAMLQQNFGKAIELLMTGRSKSSNNSTIESSNESEVRKIWKESGGDVEKTLKIFPPGNSMMRERTILKGLKRYGIDNPLSAIRCLHYGARIFWINAYQSYVWNIAATERVRRLGTRVVIGDLYIDSSIAGNEVHLVEGDVSKINISQIVLPLPGYKVIYPKNEIGDIYEQVLKRDGVDFTKNKSIPEATAKGSYRHLVVHPKKLRWEKIELKNDCNIKSSNHVEAAKFTFSLQSGSYATMLLRELMVNTLER